MGTTLRSNRSQPVLRMGTAILMALPMIVATIIDSPVPFETRVEAAFLWILCLVPTWSLFGQDPATRRPIPFLALIGLLYGLYYALSAALGSANQHYVIVVNPRRDYDDAVLVAMLGWIALLIGYTAGKTLLRERRAPSRAPVSLMTLQRYGGLLVMVGLAGETIRMVREISPELGGVFRFVGSLGWFGSGILVMLATQHRLKPWYRLINYAGIVGFFFLALASGSVANVAFFGTVIVMAGWIGSGQLKAKAIVAIIVGAVLVVTLRGVTGEYRQIAWYKEGNTGLVGRTTLFFTLLDKSVTNNGAAGAVGKGFQSTAGRSANLELLADVIRRTPDEVPYWGGDTYLSLVGAFVPRLIWPNKPTKELGQAFGHRYGYIAARNEGTAFNLPVLVEFYANFGMLGVAFGMCIVGLIYTLVERLVNNPSQEALISLAGVVLIIPLTNMESDFSLGFGGLIMNGASLWLIIRMIRSSAAKSRSDPALAPLQSRTLTPVHHSR